MSCDANDIKALETKNSELHDIIHNAPIPIFVLDNNHQITHFNKACEKLTRLSGREMIGTDHQWKAFYSTRRPVMADFIINRSSDAQIMKRYSLKHNHPSKDEENFTATDFFPDLGEEGKWLFFLCISNYQ